MARRTDPVSEQRPFDQDELRELIQASKDQESWAADRGYAITGDSAPPPIPLGLEAGDPAGMREALEQAVDLQKDDPPPPGATWHMPPSVQADLAELIGDDDAHSIIDLLTKPDKRDEDGAASWPVLPIAAALSVLFTLLALWLWT